MCDRLVSFSEGQSVRLDVSVAAVFVVVVVIVVLSNRLHSWRLSV